MTDKVNFGLEKVSEIDEIIHAIDLSLWEIEGELGLPVND